MSGFNLYLNDILRAIKLIEKSTKSKTFEKFKSNDELKDATSMRFQIIGESINKLGKKIQEKYKEVDWQRYLQTRNIVSHAYFAVSAEILWNIIKKDLLIFKKQILKIKKDLN